MTIGQFQPPVSRRTIASVLMHCIARTNQTSRLTATSGVQTGSAVGVAVGLHRVGEVGGVVFDVADAVDDAHRADEHLAGRERADQADAHLPVEAERPDRRLDHVAEAAGDAVAELLGGGDGLVATAASSFSLHLTSSSRPTRSRIGRQLVAAICASRRRHSC